MKRFLNSSGQLFILAGFIALLLLTTIPLIIFLTRTYASHQVAQLKKSQALAIAEAGISYISHELNGSLAGQPWSNALANNFGTTDCHAAAANPIAIPGVGSVKFTCIAFNLLTPSPLAPDLEPYQVAVIATAYMPQGVNSTSLVPTRAMEAYLSRRTLGITLPNGTQAGAALQLARVPTSIQTTQAELGGNALIVHWGPIVNYQLAPSASPPAGATDPFFWTMLNPLDTMPGTTCPNPAGGTELCPGYPRKFSDGGLTGKSGIYPRQANNLTGATVTDNYEWWAYASLQVPPQLDLNTTGGSYQVQAAGQTTAAQGLVGGIASTCAGVIPNATNHLTGTAPSTPCTVDLSNATMSANMNSVLYIDGADVHISGPTKNLMGTIIVANNLVIDANPAAPGNLTNQQLTVPTSAYKEYLAITSAQTGSTLYTWPCGNSDTTPTSQNKQCTSTQAVNSAINFTGFLYVGGNMTVNTPWVMNGALAVGDMTHQYLSTDNPTGQLIIPIPAGGQLTLLYNAPIAHNISVLSNELQIDRIQETSPQ